MKDLSRSRFIVGLVLIAASAGLFLFGEGGQYTTAAIVFGVLGLITVAISRKQVR